jgi:hypothetical protein
MLLLFVIHLLFITSELSISLWTGVYIKRYTSIRVHTRGLKEIKILELLRECHCWGWGYTWGGGASLIISVFYQLT